MKNKILLLATLALMILSMTVGAEQLDEERPFFLVEAANSNTAVVNGKNIAVHEPLIVFGNMYVDLYETAELLGASVEWIPADCGYFDVTYQDKTTSFTLIGRYDDLEYPHKFFTKGADIYVSVSDLAEIVGYNVKSENGMIEIFEGEEAPIMDVAVFGWIQNQPYDLQIYLQYSYPPQYMVYPYQEYSYDIMQNDIGNLKKRYPELIKVSSIGNSVEGRELPLIQFGNGETKIFVCGTHHAREYISTTYLMYAIDRYAYAYKTGGYYEGSSVKDVLDSVTFYIVPMVNPDGVNLVQNGVNATKNPSYVASMSINAGKEYGYKAWKANVNGVDLNWNYDKDWSITKNSAPRGSTGFNGEHPATEPETIAMMNYLDNNSFEAFISIHTQGQIFYFADDMENPTYVDRLIHQETGFEEHVEKATGLGGSFFDYVYRKFKKTTITFELCKYIGPHPYPNEKFDEVWKPVKTILLNVAQKIA